MIWGHPPAVIESPTQLIVLVPAALFEGTAQGLPFAQSSHDALV
jgi:hypothetical protein